MLFLGNGAEELATDEDDKDEDQENQGLLGNFNTQGDPEEEFEGLSDIDSPKKGPTFCTARKGSREHARHIRRKAQGNHKKKAARDGDIAQDAVQHSKASRNSLESIREGKNQVHGSTTSSHSTKMMSRSARVLAEVQYTGVTVHDSHPGGASRGQTVQSRTRPNTNDKFKTKDAKPLTAQKRQ